MRKQKLVPLIIDRMNKPFVIFKTLKNQQIRTMMKLKNLLKLKIFLKKPVVILNISIQKQVLILKYQLQQLDMMKTHIIHIHIIGLWIFMSKISIKMIRIYGGQSASKWMNLILDILHYLLNRLLITIKPSKQDTKYSI